MAPSAWSPPHRVLDVVLTVTSDSGRVQHRRSRFRSEVVEPVEEFRQTHPGVRTLDDLRALIASYPTPADFAREALGAEAWRGAVALSLVNHLLSKLETWADALDGTTEAERLADAMSDAFTSSTDAYDVEGKPIDEVGYAYLRMRLGAPVVVPEALVTAFVQEVLGQAVGGATALFGEAVCSASLPPLALLQSLREDWAQGRVWSVGAPDEGADTVRWASWVPFLDALLEAFENARDPEALGNRIGRLHRDAPHAPPGADEALRGDHLAAYNALRRGGEPPSYVTVANRSLCALHMGALGNPMDTEVEFALVHEAAADLIRALLATDEPVAPGVMRCLRSLFERSGERALPWHRTTL